MNRKSIVLVLLAIGILVWLLNHLTPERSDDYWYKFTFITYMVDTERPITSLNDVFVSQCAHYRYVNSRNVVHFIVQLFSGILGKPIFNICNAGVFVLFVWLLTGLYRRVTALNLLFVSAVLLLLFPAFGQTMLWLTGSVNYLWSSTAVCLFLTAICRLRDCRLRPVHILCGLPCVFAGWTHEGITFPLALSLCIYVAVNRKTVFKKAIFPLIVWFIVGAFLCTFSPPTFARAGISEGFGLSRLLLKISSGLALCLKLKAFYVLLFTAAVSYCRDRQTGLQRLKEFYAQNMIVCNALLFSFIVVFMSGFVSSRSAVGVELFSIMLLLRVFIGSDAVRRTAAVKTLVCIIGGGIYGLVLCCSVLNFNDCRKVMEQIKSGASDIIVYDETKLPGFAESYVVRPNRSFDFEEWNHLIAAIYHLERLAFVHSVVYNDIISGSERLYDIVAQRRDYPYYVLPVEGHIEDKQLSFMLDSVDCAGLPFYIRPFASWLDRYSITEVPVMTQHKVLNIDGREYLFICKNPVIDDRIREIILR